MAYGTTYKFGTHYLQLGDGASSETFSAPCGTTSHARTDNKNNNETLVPDCTDPDLPGQLVYDEVSSSMQIEFSGVVTSESISDWTDWSDNGGEKNIKWVEPADTYTGAALLTSFSKTGEKGNRWTVSGTVTFVGKPTKTATT